MIGHVVGGSFRILEKIGEGGMGTVYRGVDLMLERAVAVKVLRADLAHRPQLAQRFRSEAVALARLNHPNVATLYSFLRDGDDFFMVMEFVEGRPLNDILERRGALPVPQAVDWFSQALDGIHHAHQLGIVHRDIKPANLMVAEPSAAQAGSGFVKVMDFGIARVLSESRMTRTGHLIGTLEYMSPEQIRSQDVDARSDIYALGILLYEMLTGRVPFEADSDFELMQAQIETPPTPPRTLVPALPEGVEQALLRALEKDPRRRFQSAAAFREALEASVGSAAVFRSRPVPGPVPPTRIAGAPKGKQEPGAPVAAEAGAGLPKPTRAARAQEAAGASEPETGVFPAPTRMAEPVAEARPSSAPRGGALLARLGGLGGRAYAGIAATLLLLVTFALMLRGPTTPSGSDVPGAPPEEVVLQENGAGEDENDPGFVRDEGAEQDAVQGRSLDGRPGAWSPDARPAQVQVDLPAMLASARQYLEADQLTTPAGRNAQELCLRVLRFDADNAEAVRILHQIAQRYAARGDEQMRRGRRDQAVDQYQQGLAVAQSHPGSLDQMVAELQRKLTEARTSPRRETTRATKPEPEKVSETPATGSLRIVIRPFGDVYIDEQRKASATNQIHTETLSPGTYRVRAVHPSFGTWEKTVSLGAGQARDVLFNFNAEYTLTVTSQPSNAEILVDGRPTGRYTPSVVTLRPGQHTIEVRKQGYDAARQSLTMEQDAGQPLHFTLQGE